MGIDRIGKGGAPPTVPETSGTGGVDAPGRKGAVNEAFQVERPEAARAQDVGGAEATSALARLRAREIDLDGYLDLKVDEATKGLDGLSRAELADVKEILREQLVTDPSLADLVRTATGQLPKPREPSEE